MVILRKKNVKYMNLIKIIFLIYFSSSYFVFGADWYVNDGSTTGDIFCSAVGNNANNGSTISTPKRSLKDAYALASSGDVIYIDAGTYTDSLLTIPVAVRNGTISLIGAGSELTVFDGSTGTKRFLAQSGYTENFIMRDFTISNYTGNSGSAAFALISNCTADLTNVVITNCSGYRAVTVTGTSSTTSLSMNGGGFFCNSGGAMRLNHYSGSEASLDLNKVAFINNSGVDYGAAISIGDETGLASSSPDFDRLTNITIDSCIFENNTGVNTSAVYILNSCSSGCSDYSITYCNFIRNTVSSGSSSYGGTLVLRVDNDTWNVKHCKFEDNDSGNSVGTLTVHTGVVNVDSCYFNNNTAKAGEGQDFYSYYALSSQESAPYYLNDPTITFTNCHFNSSNDQISRSSSSATINLIKSGSPSNSSDYSGDGLANTYTWSDLELDVWDGNCTAGYFLSSGDFYWVAGDGNWSDYSNHWSSTSGGSADQTRYPTNTSNVYFDANSDVGNTAILVTMDVNGEMKNFNYISDYATFTTTTSKTISATNLYVTGGNLKIDNVNTTVSTTSDINATLTINTATYNADGSFDATGGTIDFTSTSGKLTLSSTASSLGTLDTEMGTIEYDGGTQTVLEDTYYNLYITTAGTKTVADNIDINGDLTTAATVTCALDVSTYELNVAGDLTVGAIDGLDLSDASSLLTLDGNSDQNIDHEGSTAEGGVENIFFDDFTSPDPGWTSGAISGSNSWATGVLQGTDEDPSTDYTTTNTDNRVYGQGMSSSSGDGLSDYYDSSNEWLKTPSIDCSGHTNISLSFARHAYFESCCDESYVEISTDNSAWTDLSETLRPTDGSWTVRTIDISAIADGDASIWIRWRSDSDGSVAYGGWNIDDVTISGDAPASEGFNFTNLTVDNSGGNIILNDEISVDNTLTFISGDIDASSNNLILTSNANFSGASNNSHVIGTIERTLVNSSEADFPLGEGTELRQADVTPPDSKPRVWTVSYTNSSYGDLTFIGDLTSVSETYYWDISPSSSAENSIIVLNWKSNPGIQDVDLTSIKLSHYNGSDWEEISTTTSGFPSEGSVSGSVSSFGPFTIGTTGVNPLPIKLVTFYGEKGNQNNTLHWTTASEKNNDYFTIEKTIDGTTYESIGTIQGEGNSIYHNSYSLIDNNVEPIINYYRLTQVDFDGDKTFSNLISIDNRSLNKKKYIVNKTNLLGQKINDNFTGIIIILYSDGSVERIYRNLNL